MHKIIILFNLVNSKSLSIFCVYFYTNYSECFKKQPWILIHNSGCSATTSFDNALWKAALIGIASDTNVVIMAPQNKA